MDGLIDAWDQSFPILTDQTLTAEPVCVVVLVEIKHNEQIMHLCSC